MTRAWQCSCTNCLVYDLVGLVLADLFRAGCGRQSRLGTFLSCVEECVDGTKRRPGPYTAVTGIGRGIALKFKGL